MPVREVDRKLLRTIDSFLRIVVIIVLVVNLVIFFKAVMVAVPVVKKAGIENKNILQIVNAVGMEINKLIGPLTGKYLIQAGFWSLMILILPAVSFIWKVEIPNYGYWIAIFVATTSASGLPVDKIYGSWLSTENTSKLVQFSLSVSFVTPFVASLFISKHPLIKRIIRHLIFSIVFGLLALQIIVER